LNVLFIPATVTVFLESESMNPIVRDLMFILEVYGGSFYETNHTLIHMGMGILAAGYAIVLWIFVDLFLMQMWAYIALTIASMNHLNYWYG